MRGPFLKIQILIKVEDTPLNKTIYKDNPQLSQTFDS